MAKLEPLRGDGMSRLYRSIFALIAWGTLGLQLYLHWQGRGELSTAEIVTRYLSYFTVLTNLMAAAILTLPVAAPRSGFGRWAASSPVRSAVTSFLLVVGLAYHFLLAASWNPQGLLYPVNMVLHYVMPGALLVDWLVLTPRGRLRWGDPIRWLWFPFLYGTWTAFHGLTSGWWPYAFINIDQRGWTAALTMFGTLLAAFAVVGLVLVGVDRLLGRGDRVDASA